MNSSEINWAAGELLTAQTLVKSREALGKKFPYLSLPVAYEIQSIGKQMRLLAGAKQVGWKMGLTSQAKREQMKLDSAIFGYLLNTGKVSPGGAIHCAALIHPKIECEIGFRMKTGLRGAVSTAQALEAIESVSAAFEIIDSRYKDFKYFSLPDVVADNCSAGLYSFGEGVTSFRKLDLANLSMELFVDGVSTQKSLSSEISGHPIHSLCELSSMLGEIGEEIRAGDWILAGAAGAAIELKSGQSLELRVSSLPPLSLKCIS